jgi:hypothetical protein
MRKGELNDQIMSYAGRKNCDDEYCREKSI